MDEKRDRIVEEDKEKTVVKKNDEKKYKRT